MPRRGPVLRRQANRWQSYACPRRNVGRRASPRHVMSRHAAPEPAVALQCASSSAIGARPGAPRDSVSPCGATSLDWELRVGALFLASCAVRKSAGGARSRQHHGKRGLERSYGDGVGDSGCVLAAGKQADERKRASLLLLKNGAGDCVPIAQVVQEGVKAWVVGTDVGGRTGGRGSLRPPRGKRRSRSTV